MIRLLWHTILVNLVHKSKLIALLNKVFDQVGKHTSDDEITYICPFHTAVNNIDRKKFGIDLQQNGAYNCFACGVSGRSLKTLFKKLKVKPSIFRELYEIVGETFNSKFTSKKEKESELKLPDEFLSMAIPTKSLYYRHAVQYLKKRNITRDDVLRYNIGYCEEGYYKNRIIIPSYDKNGNINFFSARDFLNSSKFKYLLPDWSKNIIGFELFINWNGPSITLVEGTFDAISVRRNAIPLFGKMLSDVLRETISVNKIKVNVCLDNDAFKDALQISKKLTEQGVDVSLIRMDGKDPSIIGFDGINKIVESEKIFDFSDLLRLKMAT